MNIDPERCVNCLECIVLCPMNSIFDDGEAVSIDQDECVECGVCLKSGVCPVEAIYMPDTSKVYPRSIRAQFSDPGVEFPTLKQGGRGTEEMKTNDVTGRYRRGEYGMTLEFGRPGIGTKISEIEKVLKVLFSMGVEIEKNNPVFLLLEDENTGKVKPEVLGEKVLSAILEFKINEKEIESTVNNLLPVLEQVDTVVSWGLVTRFSDDGSIPATAELEEIGFQVRPNAKINLGLGRPLKDS